MKRFKPAGGLLTRLLSVATAVPPLRVSQSEALNFILNRLNVRPATQQFYRRVFAHPSVATRHFALTSLDDVLEPNLDRINRRFEREAVKLSVRSLRAALKQANLQPKDVGFLVVTTCTGYVCPGLAAHVIGAASLRSTVQYADLVGMGCGAALPALQAADNFCRSHPGQIAAVVSTEICSAAMYSDDAADLVISNGLFADGSAAALLRAGSGKGPALTHFSSVVVPEWRDGLRFRTEEGRLRNVLVKEVPDRAAVATRELLKNILSQSEVRQCDITRWVLHAGGAKILEAQERVLGLSRRDLAPSWAVLKKYGNLSSPTVLFALKESMARHPPRREERAFMASFGAGFSAHAVLLEFP
ncbi:MAG: type III polyketide synthase [Elusimicrobia bacterium]|nr:type III polyketide synthase [Elusimicrobiota bacterium]